MCPKKNELNKAEQSLIQMRRTLYRDFQKFREYYFAHYHELEEAPFHANLAAKLGQISAKRGQKLALAAPRGSAKSTIISLEYVVYSICHNLEEFIVLVSSTADLAGEYLDHIKRELESNPRLRKDFPEVCELDKKPKPKRWSRYDIITKNGIRIVGLGVDQKIRGKKHAPSRPTLVILDDVEGDDMVQNEDSRFKLQDWFEKSVLKVGARNTNFLFAGTIHHYGSLLAQYTDPQQSPGWDSCIYRSVIKWSENINDWTAWANIYRRHAQHEGADGPEAARAYFEARRDAMLAGTEVLWPSNKGYYDLMVMREDSEISFDSEMQNEPVNLRDSLFRAEDFHYWDDKFVDEATLLKSVRYPQIYAACDPSMGKSTTRGDFSAFLTGVWESSTKTLYVLDVDMARRPPANLIETILGYHASRKISKLSFEANQFQQLLVDKLKEEARARKVSLSIHPVENRKDKLMRIQALEPYLKTGKIQFSHRHRELITQLKYFPKYSHDDGPDALEMLYQIAKSHVDYAAMNAGLERVLNGLRQREQWNRWHNTPWGPQWGTGW